MNSRSPRCRMPADSNARFMLFFFNVAFRKHSDVAEAQPTRVFESGNIVIELNPWLDPHSIKGQHIGKVADMARWVNGQVEFTSPSTANSSTKPPTPPRPTPTFGSKKKKNDSS